MEIPTHLQQATERILTQQATQADKEAVREWLYAQLIPGNVIVDAPEGYYEEEVFNRMRQQLLNEIDRNDAENNSIPVISIVPLFKRSWFRYSVAAMLLLSVGAGIYFWQSSPQTQKSIPNTITTTYADITPGSNKAIWTQTNGKQIELDSTVLDMTSSRNEIHDSKSYNELRTPKGGQYQLILPDGSKVWLNAASSIKYPTQFDAKERLVEITGEAYFEIAKNRQMPFRVQVSNGTIVEVLGTQFNINAYSNEENMQTTLLQGSVRVVNGTEKAILTPGQQAQVAFNTATQKIIVKNQTNTDKIIAWKQGSFNFDGSDLKEMMRQLERWYNIDVIYKGNIPVVDFFGEMSRNVPLSAVLRTLEKSGVHFKMEENRKLIILP